MDSIILIGNDDLDIQFFESLNYPRLIKMYRTQNELTVECDNGYLKFIDDFDLIKEYDSDELTIIPYDKPKFIIISGSIPLIEEFLLVNKFPVNTLMDNDHGIIAPIDFFVDRNTADSAWN